MSTRRFIIAALVPITLAIGCRLPSGQSEPPAQRVIEPDPKLPDPQPLPTLHRDGESLYVTGLPRVMAPWVRAGGLLTVRRPISGTMDFERVAIIDVSESASPGVGTVSVRVKCQSLRDRARDLAGLAVEPLSPADEGLVGQCFARVAEVAAVDHPQPHVRIDVGSDKGLMPGDMYTLLGQPVVADGYVPFGLDTRLDGQCQISGRPGELGNHWARCIIIQHPNVEGSLHNRYAVFVPRERSGCRDEANCGPCMSWAFDHVSYNAPPRKPSGDAWDKFEPEPDLMVVIRVGTALEVHKTAKQQGSLSATWSLNPPVEIDTGVNITITAVDVDLQADDTIEVLEQTVPSILHGGVFMLGEGRAKLNGRCIEGQPRAG